MDEVLEQLRNSGVAAELAAGGIVLLAAALMTVVAIQAKNECQQALGDLHRIPGL